MNSVTKTSTLALSMRRILKHNWLRMKGVIVQQDKGADEFHSLSNPS